MGGKRLIAIYLRNSAFDTQDEPALLTVASPRRQHSSAHTLLCADFPEQALYRHLFFLNPDSAFGGKGLLQLMVVPIVKRREVRNLEARTEAGSPWSNAAYSPPRLNLLSHTTRSPA